MDVHFRTVDSDGKLGHECKLQLNFQSTQNLLCIASCYVHITVNMYVYIYTRTYVPH